MNRIRVYFIVLGCLISSSPAGAVDFTFAIWSDTHFGYWEGGGFRDNAAQDIITLPGKAYPAEIGGTVGPIAFVILPGDITENSYYWQYEDDDGISDGDFITCINRWFVPLGIPVYEVTGNHDSWNPPGCDQVRAAIAARHGATSYSFDYQGMHIIGLDGWTGGATPFSESALVFLENHMPTVNTDRAVLIFNHFDGEDPPHAQWDRFYNAIKNHNVVLHCTGHDHYPDVKAWRGFDVFITSDCKVNHANPGFSVVHVTDTRLTGIAYDWDKNEWYRRDDAPYQHIFIDKAITGLGPRISLAPASILAKTTYQIAPPNATFTVANSGTGTLNYVITDNAGWLSVSPVSGSSTGEADTIQVIYNVTGLAPGTYNASITVTDPNASNSPATVVVELQIAPIPCDLDGDFDVDQADFGRFQACLTGMGIAPTDPICLSADVDKDNDVDSQDFILVQKCLSGPNVPANPQCAQP